MAPDALDPFDVRRRVDFVLNARRTLLPLPLVDRPQTLDPDIFPPLEPRPAAGLRNAAVGIAGSAGSGATVALVGVARACEEAGIEPAAIAACSGSALWGAMWAAGLSAEEMAEFSLSWQPQDHLDIQWSHVPRFAFAALRDFSGLATGLALERLFDRRLWHMSAGESRIPFHTLSYNLDSGRLEVLGSHTTPELTLGELVRIAVARPRRSEAVRVEGELYVDGGVVDAFPVEPLLDAGVDHVIGLNVALPRGLDGVAEGAREDPGAAQRAELARRSRARLGDRLTLVEPLGEREPRPPGFYDLFLDRRRWPRLMRSGYDATVEALAPLRGGRRGAA